MVWDMKVGSWQLATTLLAIVAAVFEAGAAVWQQPAF
jgi:hypothetical protein